VNQHHHPHDHDVAGDHDHDHDHDHEHDHTSPSDVESRPPTRPSEAVLVDVGERAGALVLRSTSAREGLEVEIHPASDATRRTHVWVLPRRGRGGDVIYAAVFPSLVPDDYMILEPDGEPRCTIRVPANVVTNAAWD
jgi:ABC-type Zn2+ transport system substrate-binding protein/surface adhesin